MKPSQIKDRESLLALLNQPEYKARVEALAKRLRLKFLVLFGSFARGRVTPMSDIDFAYLSSRDDPRLIDKMWGDLAQIAPFDRNIDVVDLGAAPPLLRFEVGQTGILLYGAPRSSWGYTRTYYMKTWDDCKRFEWLRLAKLDREIESWDK